MLTPATTDLISKLLGHDTDLHAERNQHPQGSAEWHLLGLVLLAADRLSDLERQLRQRAYSVTGILIRLTARLDIGQACQPQGELQSTGSDIDLLAARHADAHQRLVETLRAYRETAARQ
jgi:hypothetical protein